MFKICTVLNLLGSEGQVRLFTLQGQCTCPSDPQPIIFASSDTPNVGDSDGDVSETKLTERQQKILDLIKESPTITGKQMSKTLSVSQRTIERDLSALQKIGALKHEGKDNDGTWIVFRT